jgi:hypothetical protein
MELEEAIKNTKNRIKSWENIAEIGKHALSKEEYENSQNICEEQKALIEELDRLQKENDLAKKALIANSYEADERNNLLVKIQKLQKEKEELKNERNIYRTQVNSAFDKGFIHKDKIRELIENWKPKLEETDRKVEKAKNQEERVVLQCIGLRLDERIKTLKDLLKEE